MVEQLRQIKAIRIEKELPASILDSDEKPTFEWVDPSSLYIEAKYQRNISDASLRLIKNIYKNFQWSRMKPPICAWAGDKLCIIDGQHTAIAAASHQKLKKIPVMVVNSAAFKDRAAAFMGHNKDRVMVTQSQLYYSAIAAEDEIALIAKKAMDETGVSIVRTNQPVWGLGQTMAAGNILKLARNKGYNGLVRILKILMEAKRAPICALELSALACLLWDKDWIGKFDDYDMATVIRSKTTDQWRAYTEANIRKGQDIRMNRSLAIAWFKHVPKIKSSKGGIKIKTLGKKAA